MAYVSLYTCKRTCTARQCMMIYSKLCFLNDKNIVHYGKHFNIAVLEVY